jgi:mannosyltransferase OCH1-like enzyme
MCINEKSYFSDFKLMQIFTSAHINNNSKRIPLIIHQTHKDLKIPINMYNNMHKWIDSNKEFEHRYYDDKMIEEIISKYPDPQVYTAFKKLSLVQRIDRRRHCCLSTGNASGFLQSW